MDKCFYRYKMGTGDRIYLYDIVIIIILYLEDFIS